MTLPMDKIGVGTGIEVIIETAETGKVKLFSGQSDNPLEAPLKDLPIVSSVTIALQRGLYNKITLNLEMTYDQGMEFIKSPLIKPLSFVDVRLSYPELGIYTPHFHGVTTMPSAEITPEGITLTIEAQGPESNAKHMSAPVIWNDTSPADMMEALMTTYGKKILYYPKKTKDELSEKTTIEQRYQDDWHFFTDLCRMYQCDFWGSSDSKGNPVMFVASRKLYTNNPPEKKFVMRGNINPEDQVYPLTQFSVEPSWTWRAATSGGVETADIHPDTKKATTTRVDSAQDSDVGTARGGKGIFDGVSTKEGDKSSAGEVSDPKYADLTIGKRIFITGRDPNLETRAKSVADEGSRFAGLKASCSSVGIANLTPGETIEIVIANHAESFFDGNYSVETVTHTAGGDGWTTEFEVFKGGFPASVFGKKGVEYGTVQKEAASGEAPGDEVEPRDDQGVG